MLITGADVPNVFRPEAVDPETAAFNEELAAQQASAPDEYQVGASGLRASRRDQWLAAGGRASPIAHERTIPGPNGPIPVRLLVPETVRGVSLHFHGGGMALGDALYSDLHNEAIARHCNLAVMSVNYRLAPEHRYPAAPDDSEAAALWLVSHARAEFGCEALIIGGDSAGANLSVVTLIRLRDQHQLRPFRAANLVFGVYDFAGTPSLLLNGTRTIVLTARRMAWFAEQYVTNPRRLREPDISPLWADLTDLPEALFTVGTLDPLLDDSMFMHGRWLAAGNPSELAIYPGGTHLFTGHPTPIGRQACARIDRFLSAAVADQPAAP